MAQSASYVLATYSFILSSPLEKLLEVGYQSKDVNPIPSFNEEILIELCAEAQTIFEKEENILEIEGDLIIVGDIHGSFHDLLRILNFIQENKSKVLFLGDYVDRGDFSLECITLLFALKVMYPDQYYLIRGNHEFDSMCSQYGFKDEILNYHTQEKSQKVTVIKNVESDPLNYHFEEEQSSYIKETEYYPEVEYLANHKSVYCYKYSEILYNSFITAFSYLPICCIVNKTTFCIHGGLSPRLERLDHLKTGIIRPINNFEDNRLFSDVIWSDPSPGFPYLYGDNPRGRGYLFNGNAVDLFLLKNSLRRMIRAHQCVVKGMSSHFSDKCITIFSSSSYSHEMGNNSAILKLFQLDDRIETITFPPLKRLRKSEAVYYKVQNFNKKMRTSICFSIRNPNLKSETTTARMQNVHHGIRNKRAGVNIARKMFITNPRRKNNTAIKKPIILHSTSLSNFLDENGNVTNNGYNNNSGGNNSIGKTKSMVKFNELQGFVEDI